MKVVSYYEEILHVLANYIKSPTAALLGVHVSLYFIRFPVFIFIGNEKILGKVGVVAANLGEMRDGKYFFNVNRYCH